MSAARLISCLTGLLVLGLCGWSARHAARTRPATPEDVVVLLPRADLPALNPFLPADEAERQILELVHEPLIRIDREGRLATALAEQWTWRQDMTCWFESAEKARAAAQELREQPVEKHAGWDIDSVTTQGEAFVVRFRRPDSRLAEEVQVALAAAAPQRLSFIRISAPRTAKISLEAFAKDPNHAAHVKRLWFDDDGTCEIVTTLSAIEAQQSLQQWLAPRHSPVPEIRPVGEVAALLEPVLEFRMKPGLTWPDGSAITAADVDATLSYVMPQPWPISGRDAFRQIQSITGPKPSIVEVRYRRAYSPALAAWTTLPVLPAAWLAKHVSGISPNQPPPGAGSWQVQQRTPTRLTLEKRSTQDSSADASVSRVTFLPEMSPLQARIGLATGCFDAAWPSAKVREWWQARPGARALASPARHQIMLVWHTPSPVLSDVRVRRALGLVLDREALRRAMPDGLGRAHDSFFPPGFWFSSNGAPPEHGQAAAVRLLAEAGWLQNVEGSLRQGSTEMRLRLVIPEGNMDRQKLAFALAQQWNALGARVELSEVPAGRYLMELQTGRFDVALLGGELSPGWDVLPFWHSSHTGEHGLNVSQISDPQLDLLLEALVAEFDPVQVPRRAAAVETRLRALQPAQPLFTDLSELCVRTDRFPVWRDLDAARGLTLQDLLTATGVASTPKTRLQMLPPP